MNWIILTAAQRTAAMALNDRSAMVEPTLIDNAAADALGAGSLIGKYALTAAVLSDPAYFRWRSVLDGLPSIAASSETLFLLVDA